MFVFIEDTSSETTLEIGLNPKNEYKEVFGLQEGMEVVDLFDLRYNTFFDEKNRISVYTDYSGRTQVFSNHVPIGIPIYLDYIDKDKRIKSTRIRAELSRDINTDVLTPSLWEMKLKFK